MTKFLGVLLDQHLSWKYHISHVAKKVSKTIGIIRKARFFFSSKSLLSLYYTLVYPYLNYCNIAWCSMYPIQFESDSLPTLYRNVSSESFVELNILPILRLFFGLLKSLTFLTLIRSLLRVLCTHIITSFPIRLLINTTFVTNRQVYTYNTRNANKCRPYFCQQTLNSSQSSI